jgi:serine phosphatase RsbU (regulator of sigma subunit)/tetratricopeptide (TPR) repeat protein
LFVACTGVEEEHSYTSSVSQEDSLYVYAKLDSANGARIDGSLEKAKVWVEEAKTRSGELEWGKGLAMTYTNLAYINLYESDFEASMENAVEGLRIAEKCEDLESQGFANMLIGFIYFNLGDTNQVLPYYFKSLDIRLELGDQYDIGYSYSYLGNFYQSTQQYDSALHYHNEALNHRLLSGDKRSIADSYLLIGSTYLNKKDYEKAMDHFQKALLQYAEIKDKKRLAETYRNFAEVYLAQGNTVDAENFLLQANELAKETGSIDNMIQISDKLSMVNYLEGNYKEAYDYLRYHITTTKETSGESKYRDIVKNILEYKNEQEKKIKQQEYEQNQERQSLIVMVVSGILILVIVFLVFVFNRLKVTRKQKEIIAFRKVQVDRAYQELGSKNKEILDSINYAKRIQSAILPSDDVIQSKFKEVFVLYLPKDIVAGDFYWLEQKDNKLLFAVADCTGHGVPGAMVSVVCNNSLNRSVHEYGLVRPNEILDKTRELVVNEFAKSVNTSMMDGMDIALCSLDANDEKGVSLAYAGANNPLWVLRNNATAVEEHSADKQPIGKTEHAKSFKTTDLQLEDGDTIYLFSDGYADQFGGERGKKLKKKQLRELILSMKGKSLSDQKKQLHEFFLKWQGDLEQIDDVCIMGVRF